MSVIGTGGNLPPQVKRIRDTKAKLFTRIRELEAELRHMEKLIYFAVGIGGAIGAGATAIGFLFK